MKIVNIRRQTSGNKRASNLAASKVARAQKGAAFHQLQFLLRKVMETRLKGGEQDREDKGQY